MQATPRELSFSASPSPAKISRIVLLGGLTSGECKESLQVRVSKYSNIFIRTFRALSSNPTFSNKSARSSMPYFPMNELSLFHPSVQPPLDWVYLEFLSQPIYRPFMACSYCVSALCFNLLLSPER